MATRSTPVQITNYLLFESRESGEALTNLKLQKLLYYSQAWFITLHDRDELFSEDFEAWIHGPVLPSAYHRFKDNRWRPIEAEIERPELPEDVAEHLDEILRVFGGETAIALENMTHEEMPWLRARGNLAPHESSHAVIQKEWMEEFCRSL